MHRADVLAFQPRRRRPAARQERNAQQRLGVHPRFKPQIPVLDNHADANGPRRAGEHRLDERHGSRQGLVGLAFHADLDPLANPHPEQLRLVDLQDQPEALEVGDRVERIALFHVLAGPDVLFDHRAAERRVDNEVVLGLARFGQGVDLFVGDSPEEQAAARGGRKARRGTPPRGPRLAVGPQCGEELFLSGKEFRAVDAHQVLALPDVGSGKIGVDLVDSAGDPRRNVGHAGLVELDTAHGPQLLEQLAGQHLRGLHLGHPPGLLVEHQAD